jgi:glycosyltransferase involved in cell wall biosynthesis
MKISIALATYNGAKYLMEQLESFISQTRLPDELVVCDDNSSDDTLQLLEHFRETAPFDVRIYRNSKNIGYGQNFSRALTLCQGDLVFLSDQDDVWFENKLSTIEKQAYKKKRVLLFMNDAEIVFEDLTKTGDTLLRQLRAAGNPDSGFIIGCCIAVRKTLLTKILPVPEKFTGHDRWLSWFADGLNRKDIIDESCQLYRRHEMNTSPFLTYKKKGYFSRISYLVQKAMLIYSSQHEHRLKVESTRLALCLDQAKSWFSNETNPILSQELEHFIANLRIREKNIEERIKLKNRKLLSRIVLGAKLLQMGGYETSSGLKSYLRDVIFR